MEKLIEVLRATGCSLVVENDGVLTTYDRPGVRDLVWLLDNDPRRLRGARVADKVTGRAAAALMVQGGVAEVYAAVMSLGAQAMLREAGIACTCGKLVDHIADPEGDRCPLERIVASARTAAEAEAALRHHFDEMKQK